MHLFSRDQQQQGQQKKQQAFQKSVHFSQFWFLSKQTNSVSLSLLLLIYPFTLHLLQPPSIQKIPKKIKQNLDLPKKPRVKKMGLKSTTGGEIVQVQGGHIIRSTGRKDRHSKVFTAKGARDRRVRLAAHTAIQFYDVQDRLGYDRPSKAVDWLMNKAKAEIDKLAKLPSWDPNNVIINEVAPTNNSNVNVGLPNKEICMDSELSQFYTTDTHYNSSFQNYPQNLCLSLQTHQDPGVGGSGNHGHDSGVFNGGLGNGWAQQHEMGRFTTLFLNQQGLSAMGSYCGNNNQRSTLQSNYANMGRVLEENHQLASGFGHGSDGLMGFYVPTTSQIHGDGHGGGVIP